MNIFNLKIRGKYLVLFISVLFFIFFSITTTFIFNMYRIQNNDLKIFKTDETEKRKNILKQYTEIVFNTFDEIHENSVENKSEEEIKGELKNIIDNIRYDNGVGYFWINDTGKPIPKMIMHPTVPSLNGQILNDKKYNCAFGKDYNLFNAFVDVCEKDGEGFVDYLWPKPTKDGLTENKPKISYVRLFKEYDWVIGTGLYFDDIDEAVQQKKAEGIKAITRTSLFVTVIFVFIILLGLVIVYIFSSRISKPLIEIVDSANKISDGDFNVDVNKIKSSDEVGLLNNSFHKMIDSLQYKLNIIKQIAEGAGDFTIDVKLASENDILGKTIAKMLNSLNAILGQVNYSVYQINAGSNQIAQASQTLAQGSTEQASSLEEISSAVLEIKNQSQLNAESAFEVNNLAKESLTDVKKGNDHMSNLVKAMNDINASADDIKKIVKVIDDISFQTNLLSLNASVEAARAGKYGKGFSVVAEEVRNLAARSSESVTETTEMVDFTIKNIEKGNTLVKTTAGVLEDITNSVVKVVELVDSINISSKEQSSSIDQISKGLSQIDSVTQSNTASSEEFASAAEELSVQIGYLKEIVSKFKLMDINEKNKTESKSVNKLIHTSNNN